MKTLEMNPNGSLYLNSLIPLTLYLISTSHILLSPVLFHCPEHTVTVVPCLRAFPTGIFLHFLVYSVCSFSLTLSFYALFGVSSQNFKLLFILILVFLTHTFNSQKTKNSIKEKKQNQYTNKRWTMESPSPNFLQGHPWTPLHYLCSPPSRPLSPNSISAPS